MIFQEFRTYAEYIGLDNSEVYSYITIHGECYRKRVIAKHYSSDHEGKILMQHYVFGSFGKLIDQTPRRLSNGQK